MDDKQTVVAAIAYDVQKNIIRKLTIALIIALIVCGVSVATALYTVSCHQCKCGERAHIIGVASVASAYVGRYVRQNVKRNDVTIAG